MSPKLNIQQTIKPKVRDKIIALCTCCGEQIDIIFRDLIRSTNKHLSIGLDGYHCSRCLKKSDEYKNRCSNISKNVLNKIVVGASERSKALWQDPNYRAKMAKNHAHLSSDKDFAEKISKSISAKFRNDSAYVAKVDASRYNKAADFIFRCSQTHDNFYDYSRTKYVGVNELFDIICPKHGVFSQLPSNHLKGHGCPQCAADRSKLSASAFFARCADTHDGKYDYSESIYDGSLAYVEYRCKQHGAIRQLAQNHLKGAGCRFCAAATTSSNGEKQIGEYIKSLSFDIINNDRAVLDGQEIDIFVSKARLGVEYHGIYWHSFNMVESQLQKKKHFDKLDLALAKGISLIQIYENEWLDKPNIVKSMLGSKLGCSKRLYARNCDVVVIPDRDAGDFFNENHLNGHRKSNLCVALIYKSDILAAASFHIGSGRNELMRFCNKLGYTVVGGLSRLIKNSGCDSVFTYADRRYSPVPKGYLKSGFKCIGVTKQGYCYCKGTKLYSRQSFQKHKLASKLIDFDVNLTEAQNMFANGYRRLWDAGHYKLIWSNNEDKIN